MDKNADLKEYLATGKAPDLTNAEDAAIVFAEIRKNDPFFDVLTHLCAVEMLAKDFHYRAKGKPFYGNHLLADLIHDVGKGADDLNEIHYMGELVVDPPFRADVARAAVAYIDAIPGFANETGLVDALLQTLTGISSKVEFAKKTPNMLSGTAAVLDDISKKALQGYALLNRVVKGDDFAEKMDAAVEIDEMPTVEEVSVA